MNPELIRPLPRALALIGACLALPIAAPRAAGRAPERPALPLALSGEVCFVEGIPGSGRFSVLGRPVAVSPTGLALPGAALAFLGANPAASGQGEGLLGTRVHRFRGRDPQRWIRGASTFQRVRYPGVYPGVDLVYHGGADGQSLEYDFELAPRADPSRIRIEARGARRLALDRNGDLLLTTVRGTLRQRRPRAYQQRHGRRVAVPCSYRLQSGTTKDTKGKGGIQVFGYSGIQAGAATPTSRRRATESAVGGRRSAVSLALGPYDRSLPLVVDPEVVYATGFSGSGEDEITDLLAGQDGAVYLCGGTTSPDLGNPGGPPDPGFHGDRDAFVARLDPETGAPLSVTFLGGMKGDHADGLAQDAAGNLYVAGGTDSAEFPTTPGAVRVADTGGFVVKLSPAVGTVTWSGICAPYSIQALAVNAQGEVALAALAVPEDSWPRVSAFQPNYGGGALDTWAGRLQADGSRFLWATYLGGSGMESVTSVAIDATGAVTVAGTTYSPDFPHVVFPVPAGGGDSDAFVARFDSAGRPVFCGAFGGRDEDAAVDLKLDAQGFPWVLGWTLGKGFPHDARSQPFPGGRGESDAYLMRLRPDGSGFTDSFFLGGRTGIGGTSLALDPEGKLVLLGTTSRSDFPLLHPVQRRFPQRLGRSYTAVLMKLDPRTRQPLFATFLGRHGGNGSLMAVGAKGQVYLWGRLFPFRAHQEPTGFRPSVLMRLDTRAGTGQGKLAVSAERLVFPTRKGAGSRRSFCIRNTGKRPLTVRVVAPVDWDPLYEDEPPIWVVTEGARETVLAPGERRRVSLRYVDTFGAPPRYGTLWVVSSGGEGSIVPVDLVFGKQAR